MTKKKGYAPKPRATMAPLKTLDLIALAKHRLAKSEPPGRTGEPMTDYRLAKRLEVRQALVSNWKLGKTRIGRKFVGKFAEVTNLPVAFVFASLELEREKDPDIRRVLEGIAAMVAKEATKRAASFILATGMGVALAAPVPSQAATAPVPRAGVCILW